MKDSGPNAGPKASTKRDSSHKVGRESSPSLGRRSKSPVKSEGSGQERGRPEKVMGGVLVENRGTSLKGHHPERRRPTNESGRGRSQTTNAQKNQPATTHRPHQHSHHALGVFRQSLFASNIALSYINVGASIAWSAPLLYDAHKGREVSIYQSVATGSLMFLFQMIPPIPAGILSDRFGRKPTLIFAGIASCVSWLLVVFIKDVIMLYFSRILAGLWAGVVLTVVPLYIAEIASPKIRGALTALSPIMLILGSIITFVLGPNVESHLMAITCGVLPHVFLIFQFLLPESPPWLIYKRKYHKAEKSFEWLRGRKLNEDELLKEEFLQMLIAVESDFPDWNRISNLWQTSGDKRALIIVEILTACQRLSGVTAIIAYSTITLPDRYVGVLRPVDCLTVIGLVWLVSTITACALVDKIGRVPLIVASSTGCFLSNLFTATWYYYSAPMWDEPFAISSHWFPFAAFMFYGVFFVFGLGSVPSILQGEMFSPANRILASGLTVMVIGASSFLVNFVYFLVAKRFGLYVNFLFYAFICVAAAIFTLAYVPETKGKALQQIQEELKEL